MIIRRSPAWSYLGALLVVLAGWSAAVIIAAGDWDPVKAAPVTSVSERTDKGASDGRIAVYTDTLQPDRDIKCTGTQKIKAKKKKAKPAKNTIGFHDPGITMEDRYRDQTWHLVAITKPETQRANVKITCAPKDDRADTAGYGWALVPDPSRAQIGQGVGSIATAVGVVWAVVTFWRGRKARR